MLNAYLTGSITVGGHGGSLSQVMEALGRLGATPSAASEMSLPPLEFHETRVGTDEVGKGDYFGPLVVCGVLVTEFQAGELRKVGVRDSKSLSDTTISNMSIKVRKLLLAPQISTVLIPPVRYNLQFAKYGNVNRVLGWAHATAIEEVLAFNEPCKLAIADQFGDQSYIEDALKRRGKAVELVQVPKAERDTAVATASVLARDTLLKSRLEMREKFGENFPLGSTDVITFGRALVERLGSGILLSTAKVHFRTTEDILGGARDFTPALRQLAAQSQVQSEIGGLRVETSRLEGYSLLDSFEPELRAFIRTGLESHYGGEWWDRGVSREIREKAEKRRRQEAEKGRDVDIMECLDWPHYEYILKSKENWESVFKAVFGDENSLLARLRPINDLRNPVAHTRGLSRSDMATLIGSIGWMRNKMRGAAAG